MIHAVPELEEARVSLEVDIMNEKWHHVARTIARLVVNKKTRNGEE